MGSGDVAGAEGVDVVAVAEEGPAVVGEEGPEGGLQLVVVTRRAPEPGPEGVAPVPVPRPLAALDDGVAAGEEVEGGPGRRRRRRRQRQRPRAHPLPDALYTLWY